AVSTLAEPRRHVLAARFAGVTVGDEFLEAVPDLDADLAFLQREHDQQAVVLTLLTDSSTMVLEQFDGVLVDVGVWLDGRYGDDDDDVTGLRLERADHALHLGTALRIDDVREVVDWFRQLGQIFCIQGAAAENTENAENAENAE